MLQMGGIALQAMPAKIAGKETLAELDRLLRAQLVSRS